MKSFFVIRHVFKFLHCIMDWISLSINELNRVLNSKRNTDNSWQNEYRTSVVIHRFIAIPLRQNLDSSLRRTHGANCLASSEVTSTGFSTWYTLSTNLDNRPCSPGVPVAPQCENWARNPAMGCNLGLRMLWQCLNIQLPAPDWTKVVSGVKID